MNEQEVVFVCRIKILGFAFAVLSKELADEWVSQDPESHIAEELKIQKTV